MAKTAPRKLAVARRIYEIATGEFGLEPCALLFDALTFPVTTGQEELRDSAIETLEGIRRIKSELPGVSPFWGSATSPLGLPSMPAPPSIPSSSITPSRPDWMRPSSTPCISPRMPRCLKKSASSATIC